MDTKDFVAGFLFSGPNNQWVALVTKNKPDWQKGKLNAIGGKIKEGEIPLDAMIREFTEETGAIVTGWREFCQLNHQGAVIHFFVAFDKNYEVILHQMEEEKVDWWERDGIPHMTNDDIIPNLKWLIPLALDKDRVFAIVQDNS